MHGVFGAADHVLYFARRLLRGAFRLGLCVAGDFADDLFHGALYSTSGALDTILVHIRSPKLPSINIRFGRLVAQIGGIAAIF